MQQGAPWLSGHTIHQGPRLPDASVRLVLLGVLSIWLANREKARRGSDIGGFLGQGLQIVPEASLYILPEPSPVTTLRESWERGPAPQEEAGLQNSPALPATLADSSSFAQLTCLL